MVCYDYANSKNSISMIMQIRKTLFWVGTAMIKKNIQSNPNFELKNHFWIYSQNKF